MTPVHDELVRHPAIGDRISLHLDRESEMWGACRTAEASPHATSDSGVRGGRIRRCVTQGRGVGR